MATSVVIEIPEIFSDGAPSTSTIQIDGQAPQVFAPTGSSCPGGVGVPVTRTFTFTGAAAAFANDGIINITFTESGDDLSLDFSRITIQGAGAPAVPAPLMAGLAAALLATAIWLLRRRGRSTSAA